MPVSLETPIGSDGDTELGSLIPSDGPTPARGGRASSSRRQSIRRALERLDPKARAVIELRFGIGGRDPLTLREVAEQVGLSAEGVRKLERRALMRAGRGARAAGPGRLRAGPLAAFAVRMASRQRSVPPAP